MSKTCWILGSSCLPFGPRPSTSIPSHKKVQDVGRGGTRCAKAALQHSCPLQDVIVIIAPREQGRQEPEVLRGILNTLVHSLLQTFFDFSSILLCDPERGVAPCIMWPMGGWVGEMVPRLPKLKSVLELCVSPSSLLFIRNKIEMSYRLLSSELCSDLPLLMSSFLILLNTPQLGPCFH